MKKAGLFFLMTLMAFSLAFIGCGGDDDGGDDGLVFKKNTWDTGSNYAGEVKGLGSITAGEKYELTLTGKFDVDIPAGLYITLFNAEGKAVSGGKSSSASTINANEEFTEKLVLTATQDAGDVKVQIATAGSTEAEMPTKTPTLKYTVLTLKVYTPPAAGEPFTVELSKKDDVWQVEKSDKLSLGTGIEKITEGDTYTLTIIGKSDAKVHGFGLKLLDPTEAAGWWEELSSDVWLGTDGDIEADTEFSITADVTATGTATATGNEANSCVLYVNKSNNSWLDPELAKITLTLTEFSLAKK